MTKSINEKTAKTVNSLYSHVSGNENLNEAKTAYDKMNQIIMKNCTSANGKKRTELKKCSKCSVLDACLDGQKKFTDLVEFDQIKSHVPDSIKSVMPLIENSDVNTSLMVLDKVVKTANKRGKIGKANAVRSTIIEMAESKSFTRFKAGLVLRTLFPEYKPSSLRTWISDSFNAKYVMKTGCKVLLKKVEVDGKEIIMKA